MANDKWLVMHDNADGWSQGQGVGVNDGWLEVARLPMNKLPQGATKRLAINVKAHIGDLTVAGASPSKGMMQVALGFAGGIKSTKHRTSIPLLPNITPLAAGTTESYGKAMSMLMIQQASPAISDPDFGATITTISSSDLVLYARTFFNG